MTKGKIVRIVVIVVIVVVLVLAGIHLTFNWDSVMQTMRNLHGG